MVKAAGLHAIVVELCPPVTDCVHDVELDRVAIRLDVHPSGWRGKEHLGEGCIMYKTGHRLGLPRL